MGKQNKYRNSFFPTPPFFLGSTSSPNSLYPPCQQRRGMGNGGCSQFMFLSHVLCLLQHEVSPVGYGSSWTPPWVFSSRKVPAWVPPSACSPSGTEFSRTLQFLAAKPAPSKHISAHPYWDPTPALAFQRLQFQDGYLLRCGSPRDSLHHGLPRNLCSTVWITSSLSFALDLGVCRVFLTYNSHSSLPPAVAQNFVPLLFKLKNTAFSTILQNVLYYVFTCPNFSSASINRLFSFQY